MQIVAPRRSSLVCPPVLLVVLCLAFAGVAHALSVDIVTPKTDPAEVYQQVRTPFWAVAYDDKGNDVTDLATFTWSFPEAKEPVVGNPVLYRFPATGKFVVSVTATLEKDTGSDKITVSVMEFVETKQTPIEEDFTFYARAGAHTFGSTVCDAVELVVHPDGGLPGGWDWVYAAFEKYVEGEWRQVHGQVPDFEYGVGWIATCDWSTEMEKNEQVQWRVKLALDEVGADPPNGVNLTLYETWTPDNTVVKATGPELILHHADATAHTIRWDISHYAALNPTFMVTVKVYDLQGNLVATLVKEGVSVGEDSIEWDTDLPEQAGIYTYTIHAAHGSDPPPAHPCEDQDKSGVLTVTDVTLQQVEFQSRPLTFACDVHYTLSREAGDAWLEVYRPDLELVSVDGTIPVAARPHQVHVQFTVDADKMGVYYFVVHVTESPQDATENRDGQPKPALAQGATTSLLPRALDMYGRTSMGLGGYEEADKARDEQQHGPQGSNYPPPPYTATVTGHELKPVFWRLSSVDSEGHPNLQADAIFWYLGHADAGVLYTDQTTIGTKFMLFSGQGTNDEANQIYYMGTMPDGSLDRCALVMLLGCNTAVDPDGAGGDPSILAAFMDKGAACGIGSFADIFPPYVGLLSNYFWEFACRDGQSIEEAFENAMAASQIPLVWFTDPVTGELMPIGAGSSQPLRPACYR